jgi:WD40 repeat protein
MRAHHILGCVTTWLILLDFAIGAPAIPVALGENGSAGLDRQGDPLPEAAIARLGTTRWRDPLRDGSGFARVIASPDGKLVASKGDGGFSLWEVASGKRVPWFPRSFRIETGAFTPDGKSLITVDNAEDTWPLTPLRVKPVLCHWEVGTGRLLRRVQLGTFTDPLWLGTFAPDGKLFLAINLDGELSFFDTSSGKTSLQVDANQVPLYPAVAWSPNNRFLALVGEKGEVSLFELATGKRLHRFTLGEKRQPDNLFGSEGLALSPDGKTLVVSTWDSVFAWDTGTGRLQREIEDCRGLSAFSPDGKHLACGDRNAIRIWDAQSLQELRRFEDHHDIIRALTFSADGRRVVTGQEHLVGLWDVATGKQLNRLPAHQGVVYSLAFARDGKLLASGGDDGSALVWDLPTGTLRQRCAGHHHAAVSLAFSPDGKLLATGDGEPYGSIDDREAQIRCWNLDDGRVVRRFTGHLNSVESLAFSHDGKLLASSGGDARARVWDPATGKRVCQIRGEQGRRTVRFSPDGQQLLVASTGGTLGLWQAGTDQKVRHFGPQGNDRRYIVHAAFLADGKTILSEEQGDKKEAATLRFWDAESGRELRSVGIQGSHPFYSNAPSGHAISPDGTLAATTSANREGSTIQVWDTTSGKLLILLRGHTSWVTSLAFAPDGKTLASGSYDTTVLLWDISKARRYGLWHLLAGTAEDAKLATSVLAGNPAGTIPFLKERLLLATAREAPYASLIADLDNDQFEVREKAERRLEQVAVKAEFALQLAAVGGSSAEVKRRVRLLLDKLLAEQQQQVRRLIPAIQGENAEDALQQILRLGPAAEQPLRNALEAAIEGNDKKGGKPPWDQARQRMEQTLEQMKGPNNSHLPLSPAAVLRALDVLETMGTRDARQVLEEVSKGTPAGRLTQEAKAALERLRKVNSPPR